MPNRQVSVGFFRANRASKSGEWLWPEDNNVAAMLVNRYHDQQHVDGWPTADWWGRSFLIEVHTEDAPTHLGVSTIRSDALPLVLRDGHTAGEPLDINERDRLLEPTYLTFFGDRIVALVRTNQTPGHRASAAALSKLTGVDLELNPIPRPDILAMIQRGRAVANLSLTIAAGSIDAAAETDDIVEAAERLREIVPPAQVISITLRAEDEEQRRMLRSRALQLLERGTAGLKNANVGLYTAEGRYEVVDLLESNLTLRFSIDVVTRTRHLLPEDAHSAAVQAFEEMRPILTRAIHLADPDG